MKVLWVNTNFMHPTTKGGQIRTLEMLRHLHRWHQIHYVAIEDPAQPEGPGRSQEYSFRAYPMSHRIPPKGSPAFLLQLARGLLSPMPVAVSRFYSPKLGQFVEGLMRHEHFDRAVVDHLAPTSYFPDLARSLLFQHNVETVIWRRHAEHAGDPVRRMYFRRQADLMLEYERNACRTAGHVVAVSSIDTEHMRTMFGVSRVTEVPTGVNLDYFTPPPTVAPAADLVFVGSMDWLPNIDGVTYFIKEILPRIRRRKPACTLAIVGRKPSPKLLELARKDPKIIVTGTVADVRPYLWGSSVSIVPLRIGGGTRLKIYEAMAARIPVISTSIGAEGLVVNPPENIRIADTPQDFADQCMLLLDDAAERKCIAEAAWEMVSSCFSWEKVARRFERILEAAPSLN
jgi:glycosyltransferase involved in cell wall biosynthesis